MKFGLIVVLVLILSALGATFLLSDPGYVMIKWFGTTYEMAVPQDRPPLELLFTVEEETGLTGALLLDPLLLNGTRLINLDSDTDLPVGKALDPGARAVPLFTLRPTRSSGRRGYGLQYSYAQGNPESASHDDTHLYLLPFAHGTKFRL